MGRGSHIAFGVWWGPDNTSQTSNWKAFCNIVTALEDEAREGNLAHSDVIMFTDNSTVESCCTRGTSSSPKLLDLVIQLRCLTTKYGLKINVFHISGTRMIAQGTDGVSRGFLGAGVMDGQAMTSFIERHPPLVEWIKSWTTHDLIRFNPVDWFERGHDIDGWRQCHDGFSRPILRGDNVYFLWTPPPFAADTAVAEMRKARIKRQTSTHVLCLSAAVLFILGPSTIQGCRFCCGNSVRANLLAARYARTLTHRNLIPFSQVSAVADSQHPKNVLNGK